MPTDRFRTKLNEQRDYLKLSCSAYDSGIEHEAIRMAVALRVLFHDTKRSKSLMTHLGKLTARVRSSAGSYQDWRDHVSLKIDLTSATPVRALPKSASALDSAPLVPVVQWWNQEPVFAFAGRHYFRADLVLAAANKDGGAHVDDHVEDPYAELCSGMQAIGLDGRNLVFDGPAPFDQSQICYAPNLHTTLLRCFAEEVLRSNSVWC